ncbi:MAG: hypothetical protein V2A66_05565 [Pseudomonadota bacterium]
MFSSSSTINQLTALGFTITLVWVIVNAVKKRPVKKIGIACLLFFILSVVSSPLTKQQVIEGQKVQESQSAVEQGNEAVKYNSATGKFGVVAESPATQPSPPQPQFVSTNFKDFNAQFGIDSKLTDVQKDELFNSKYKGKPIKWRGKVAEVTKTWGDVSINVKNLQTTLMADVIITVKKSEENKAMQLSKGDTITYAGILVRWGTIMPHSVDEGEIIGR